MLFKIINRLTFKKLGLLFIATILLFSLVYWTLSNYGENGINNLCDESSQVSYFDALYFSIVTVSTLGYGDLHPLGISRIFSSIEVLIGIVFGGIIIAKIVSKRDSHLLQTLYHRDSQDQFRRFNEYLVSITNEFRDLTNGLVQNNSDPKFVERFKGHSHLEKRNIYYNILAIILGFYRYIHYQKNLEDRLEEDYFFVAIPKKTIIDTLSNFRRLLNQIRQKRNYARKYSISVLLSKYNLRKIRHIALHIYKFTQFFENKYDDFTVRKLSQDIKTIVKKHFPDSYKKVYIK